MKTGMSVIDINTAKPLRRTDKGHNHNYVNDGWPKRFLSKIRIEPSGCWQWLGSKSGAPGYPQYAYGRYAVTTCPVYTQIAHRFAYEFVHGSIPKHLEIDHTCQNKLCVNPDHLELVTHQENCKRRPRSGPAVGFKRGVR